jgi:hypothetical protein
VTESDFSLFTLPDETLIGRIRLTQIPLTDPSNSALYHAFLPVEGKRRLWQAWFSDKPVLIRNAEGFQIKARIWAFPAESKGHGYIVFLNVERWGGQLTMDNG